MEEIKKALLQLTDVILGMQRILDLHNKFIKDLEKRVVELERKGAEK